ncbi:MAG: hypothetical protein LC792_21460 [Actinobacteria bacterium]|nr:hypothetical protein [Actinomycetota bacterium]
MIVAGGGSRLRAAPAKVTVWTRDALTKAGPHPFHSELHPRGCRREERRAAANHEFVGDEPAPPLPPFPPPPAAPG